MSSEDGKEIQSLLVNTLDIDEERTQTETIVTDVIRKEISLIVVRHLPIEKSKMFVKIEGKKISSHIHPDLRTIEHLVSTIFVDICVKTLSIFTSQFE
jgi:septum formation topological specificity factor MinE